MSTITCDWVEASRMLSLYCDAAAPPPPVRPNNRLLRTSTPTRERRVPLGASIGCTSTLLRRSAMPGPPLTVLSPYMGWKQPAVMPATAMIAAKRAVRRGSNHHIDDPLRDDNDLFRALAVQHPLYLIERQNGSLHGLFSGIPGDRHFRPLF